MEAGRCTGRARSAFAENPEVTTVRGSILTRRADAWATPTSSHGAMNRAVDGVIHRHMQNAAQRGSIGSVAQVGMGAATGKVPPQICANLMRAGYALFKDHAFTDWTELRETVTAQLTPATERVRIQPRG